MRKLPISKKRITDAYELEFLTGKVCILEEGGRCIVVQIESIIPNIKARLLVRSNLHFSRSSKTFGNSPNALNHELNISLPLDAKDEPFRITLDQFEDNAYFLAFRFGYFTTRLFIMPQYVDRFLNEDTTWFKSFLDEYQL
jgi:hypothetical protein